MPRPNLGPHLSPGLNARGEYEIRWTVAGRSKRRPAGTGDHALARQVLAHFIIAQAKAETDGQPLPLPTAGDVLRFYKAKHLDLLEIPESRDQCMKCFMLLTHHEIADVIATELTDSDVDDYVEDRGAGQVGWIDDKGPRGYQEAKPGTVRQEVAQLKAALTYAVKNNRKAWPGLNRETMPELKMPKASPARDHWLTKDQASKLLEAALQPVEGARGPKVRAIGAAGALPPLYLFIALAMFTASRRTAIVGLPWSRVSFADDGVVDYRDPSRPVTKKRRVEVSMAPALKAILERAFEERRGPMVIDPSWTVDAFRTHCLHVLGYRVGPHILRHSWATWAANDGVSMFDIAGVLGDTVQTVEKHYAKHAPGNLRKAVQIAGIGPQNVARTDPEQGALRVA